MTPQIETGVVKFDDNQAGYIDLGTGKIRLEKEEPAEWAVEIARKELRETPENVEKAIAELKELLQRKLKSIYKQKLHNKTREKITTLMKNN